VPSQKSAAEHYEQGRELFKWGCISDGFHLPSCNRAIENLRRAIELDPLLFDAYLPLASAYWNKSFFVKPEEEVETLQQRSIDLLRQLIEIDPTRAEAYYNLSYRVSDSKERIDLLRKAVELKSEHPEAHRNLAWVLLDQEEVDEAIEQYKTHLQVTVRGVGNDNVAFAQSIAQAGRLKEAVGILDRTLALARNDSRSFACMLFQSLDLNPYTTFVEFVNTVQKLRPYCTSLEHRNRAAELMNREKIDEAIREWELQLEENPYYEGTYTSLPGLYLKQGQPDKAREVVKKYFEIDTDPLYRCRQYRAMSRKGYERFAPKIMAQLKKECEERREANR
jgi:tetratricopeptide (TPR) repeat protein